MAGVLKNNPVKFRADTVSEEAQARQKLDSRFVSAGLTKPMPELHKTHIPYESGCMIILDTMVLSKLMQQPDQQVLDGLPLSSFGSTASPCLKLFMAWRSWHRDSAKNILNEHFEQLLAK